MPFIPPTYDAIRHLINELWAQQHQSGPEAVRYIRAAVRFCKGFTADELDAYDGGLLQMQAQLVGEVDPDEEVLLGVPTAPVVRQQGAPECSRCRRVCISVNHRSVCCDAPAFSPESVRVAVVE